MAAVPWWLIGPMAWVKQAGGPKAPCHGVTGKPHAMGGLGLAQCLHRTGQKSPQKKKSPLKTAQAGT